MGTSSVARDALRNFIPNSEPRGYPKGTGIHYRAFYDEEWRRLQKEYEAMQRIIEPKPTLEERVEALEEQVRQLLEEK